MKACALLPALTLCIMQKNSLDKQMQFPAVDFALRHVYHKQGESVASYKLT